MQMLRREQQESNGTDPLFLQQLLVFLIGWLLLGGILLALR